MNTTGRPATANKRSSKKNFARGDLDYCEGLRACVAQCEPPHVKVVVRRNICYVETSEG